jgi:ATP-dependent RNA helicase RhlE
MLIKSHQQKRVQPLSNTGKRLDLEKEHQETAGFTLPILQTLSQGKHLSHRPIRALILTPTRELAAQILANIKEYGEFIDLRSVILGVNQNRKSLN